VLWPRRPAQLVRVPQPLAVQELLARRVAPRSDIALDDNGQLDWSRRAAASPRPRHIKQPLDQCASLRRGRPPPKDDEDIEVAGRPQATKYGRAMQISAKYVTAEYVVYQLQDPLDLLGLRRGPVSRLPRHDSRLDTPTRRAMREDQAARATYPQSTPRARSLITGGSSGMGLVTAQAFAERPAPR
jgi:hypothetical protein